MLTRLKLGAAVTAVLLLGAYFLAQTATDKLNEKPVTVTVTWTPASGGVTLVVRVAAVYMVGNHTYHNSPFTETYDAKPGESVLVAVDPIISGPIVHCSIIIPGQPETKNEGGKHFTCLTTVA